MGTSEEIADLRKNIRLTKIAKYISMLAIVFAVLAIILAYVELFIGSISILKGLLTILLNFFLLTINVLWIHNNERLIDAQKEEIAQLLVKQNQGVL